MPTTFLSLPREIRDQIYAVILLPADGLIEPFFAPGARHYLLYLSPIEHPPKNPRSKQLEPPNCVSAVEYTPLPGRRDNYTSTSLFRVCKQIHDETHDTFWEKNTFFFPFFGLRFNSLGGNIGQTLKSMGQVSSRLITSVCILLHVKRLYNPQEIGSAYDMLGRNLQMFASRARHGSLRNLELVWNYEGLEIMESAVLGMAFDRLLECLRKASVGMRGVKRCIRLPRDRILESTGRFGVDVVRDLHMAFGGRLFVGSELVWEDYRQVEGSGGS